MCCGSVREIIVRRGFREGNGLFDGYFFVEGVIYILVVLRICCYFIMVLFLDIGLFYMW